jgi:hypothetical protein
MCSYLDVTDVRVVLHPGSREAKSQVRFPVEAVGKVAKMGVT